jgi:dUTP pyrophosphatase
MREQNRRARFLHLFASRNFQECFWYSITPIPERQDPRPAVRLRPLRGCPRGAMSHYMLQIAVQKVGPVDVDAPAYATPGSAGLDLRAAIAEPKILQPTHRLLIPTGLRLALPEGYEGQVRPRSGLALKWGVTVLNAPGTIDADYRGEIGVVLINHGQEPFKIEPNMRIACKVEQAQLQWVDELDDTQRGSGGYGSTGL